MNDVWIKTAQFLGALNGEDIKRDSYVRTPESTEAEQMQKEKQAEWEALLSTLPKEQQSHLEEIKECLEDYASAMEKRAYMQGYVDCVQVLYHMGLLKENPGLKVPESVQEWVQIKAGSIIRVLPVPVSRGKNLYVGITTCIQQAKISDMIYNVATYYHPTTMVGEKEAGKMLEIAICEDEQADRERLQGMLYTILDKYNMERQITCYSSGEELLGSGVQFQLIFMDIVMEGRSGIDIGQEIYNRNHTLDVRIDKRTLYEYNIKNKY